MLENYFGVRDVPTEQKQRLLAVQAALEIAKASVGSSDGATNCKTDSELKYVAEHLSRLVDAIQAALENK